MTELGHGRHLRPCDRCGVLRVVNSARPSRNLCRDCRQVLSSLEVKRW